MKLHKTMNHPKIAHALFALVIIANGLFTGCASVIKGARQEIPISSDPTGALVIVDGKSNGTTPAKINLTRKHRHAVTLEKEGYITENISIEPKMGLAVAGNIIAGGLVGWGVDAITGAQYNLKPDSINVALRPGWDPVAREPREFAISAPERTEPAQTETVSAKAAKPTPGKPRESGLFAGGIFGRKERKPKAQPAAAVPLADIRQSEAGALAPEKARVEEVARIAPPMSVRREEKAQEPASLGLRVGILNYDICVSEVAKGSAAEKAGIRAGDRILSFGTMTYANSGMLVARTINNIKAGDLLVNWDSPYSLEPKAATLKWGGN